MTVGPEDLVSQLRTFAEQSNELAQGLRAIQQQSSAISITEWSRDGTVTVTVNKDGGLTDIAFTDGATRMSPTALSTTVLDCVRRATGKIGERYTQIVDGSGLDKDTAERITANYRAKNPDRFLAEPGPPPMAARRRPTDEDDDASFTVMRRGYQR